MKTPERCPWCGAGKATEQSVEFMGLYECGADFCTHCGEWLVTCGDSDTPAAVAYRQTLAWRKRLSQHTGVPLRMVPEPRHCSSDWAAWECVFIGMNLFGSRSVSMIGQDDRHLARAEARRRLLAKG